MSDAAPGLSNARVVFVTGGTGYIGRAVLPHLLRRGHTVRALVRSGSAHRLPSGCDAIIGDALNAASFAGAIAPADSFLQLVGTPSPSPSRAAEFERVDFVSVRESVSAAKAAGVRHFVYVSVAQPAPLMRAYVDARARGEALIRESGLPASILRPWYVFGPGHRWPVVLLPMYGLLWLLPSKRDTVRRLALTRLGTMVSALVAAITDPPRPHAGVRVWDVEGIRKAARLKDGTIAY